MNITLFIPILRQIMQAVGGFLIARGYMDDATAEALVGFAVNGIALIWWLIDRHRINRRLDMKKHFYG